jgi:transcriptional regulator with XRE-family HTH domain
MRRGRDKLAARRRALGHTQESLAEILGVAVSTVARWEQGGGCPLPALRRPLAEALSVSLEGLDRLLRGEEGLEEEGTRAPDGQSPPTCDEPADNLREHVSSLEPAGGGAGGDGHTCRVLCLVYGATEQQLGLHGPSRPGVPLPGRSSLSGVAGGPES